MSNEYYNPSGSPTTGSSGSSAVQRTEFAAIAAGFAKMPAIAGNGSRAVVVNSNATGLGLTTGTLALAGNFATTGAFNTTLAQRASTTLTLPAVSGTLATLAGIENLTNKTVNGLTVVPTTGVLAIAAAVTLTVSVSLSLTGTGGTTMTFPATSAAIARTDAGQTFSGTQVFSTLQATTSSMGTLTATTFNGLIFSGSGTVNFGTGGTVQYGNQTITLAGDVTGSGATNITTTVATIGGTTVVGATGTGANVFGTGPTITTATLTNPTVSTGTFTSPTLITPALGTPASGTLTNCTGLPLSTGVTGTLAAAQFPALTGDVTTAGGALATTIAAGAVSLAKMANLAANSILGNNTGSPATPLALTAAQVSILLSGNLVTSIADATNGGLNFTASVGSVSAKLQPSDLLTKASPATSDSAVIMDAAASNAAKTSTLSAILALAPFSKSYDSGDQTITSGGLLTLAHGLGVMPKTVSLWLHCLSGEAGYTNGQYVPIAPNLQGGTQTGAGAGRGSAVVADATNVSVRMGSNAAAYGILRFDNGNDFDGITNAAWALVVRAYA